MHTMQSNIMAHVRLINNMWKKFDIKKKKQSGQ